jgi:23S rRNA (adenine2503-C2)-methyltransferase
METVKKDIRNMTKEELESYFLSIGDKPYRARQVYDWLWQKSAQTFEEMTNLSKDLRDTLNENLLIRPVQINTMQVSNDRTIKNAFRLHDGYIVEGVLIPTEDRMTACVSSQVGCSLTCRFCATGKLDRIRNLDASEIYDQVALIRKQAEEKYSIPLSNIVYMGMGEPLLNYSNVLRSIELITDQKGLGMASRRITVSTAGIAKMIKRLGDDEVKFNLALSLHAANDDKRSRIMPINEANSLSALKEALQYYHHKTGSAVTYEYIVFKDFNDGIQDALELVEFSKIVPVKINLIEYNPIDGGEFQQTTLERLEAFKAVLWENGHRVNLRRSRGKDIDAACGQLANKSVAS